MTVASDSAGLERRALRIIAFTFFGLAAYVTVESVGNLVAQARPEFSPVGIAISVAALVVMPALAWADRTLTPLRLVHCIPPQRSSPSRRMSALMRRFAVSDDLAGTR